MGYLPQPLLGVIAVNLKKSSSDMAGMILGGTYVAQFRRSGSLLLEVSCCLRYRSMVMAQEHSMQAYSSHPEIGFINKPDLSSTGDSSGSPAVVSTNDL